MSFICAQSWGLRRSTAVEIPTTGAGASHSPWHHSFVAGLLQYDCTHLKNSFAFRYKGVPFLIAQKPLIFKAARAFLTAMIQGLFFLAALAFLLTILACLPLPILLTVFFFMAFMAFIAFPM